MTPAFWLMAAALPLAAQPKLLIDAQVDTHSAAAGLEREFRPLLAAQPQPQGFRGRPAAGEPPGIAWFVCGQRAALAAVAETTAGLLWPFRHAWIDPETATSLVEAHGVTPDAVVRPAYAGQAGFPILLPTSLTERLAAHGGLHGAEAVAAVIAEGAAAWLLELGDPGIVYDISAIRSSLPDYQGPSEPAAGSPPEWNADLAAHAQQSSDTSA